MPYLWNPVDAFNILRMVSYEIEFEVSYYYSMFNEILQWTKKLQVIKMNATER